MARTSTQSRKSRIDPLKAAVERLAEAQETTQTELRDLVSEVRRLTRTQQRTEERFGDLVERLNHVAGTLGNMRGDWLEATYVRKASSLFQRLLLGIRVVSPEELERIVTDAERRGVLSTSDHIDILASDLLLRGEWRATGADSYLLAGVSSVIDSRDVERAMRRAAILTRAIAEPVVAAVAGESITAGKRSLCCS